MEHGEAEDPAAAHQHPLLEELFGGYYHQDWDLDHPDADAVLKTFLTDHGPDGAAALIEELDRLRAQLQPLEEEAAQAVLYRGLGSCYIPYGAAGSVDRWLAHLQQLARDAPRPPS